MLPDFFAAQNTTIVIDENGSLNQFYAITESVRKSRHVRFIAKNDEADNIEWHFKYYGHPLMLQYSIYNGLSISAKDSRDGKYVSKLLLKIQL